MDKSSGIPQAALEANAEEKLLSAKLLADSGQFDDAFYLCGYAIEFLLKAVVCSKCSLTLYPDNDKKYRTHNLEQLIDLAGIRALLASKMSADIDFQINWSLATKWSPRMRYASPGANAKENYEELIAALTSPEKGVLSWLNEQL